MLSLLINNLHVKLYSSMSIGVISTLGSLIDFNVASTVPWQVAMGSGDNGPLTLSEGKTIPLPTKIVDQGH